MSNMAREAGRTAMGLPGEIIKGIWDKINELSAAQPMLAPLFYLLGIGLMFAVIVLPLVAFKWLLPDVFNLLQHWIALLLRAMARCFALLLKVATSKNRSTS